MADDVSINKSKAWAYTESNFADRLSTKFNRLDPTKEVEFKKMTGEEVGQFLNNRGIKTAWTQTVWEVSDLFQKSIQEADEWLALIQGKFKMQGWDDYVGIAIDDLQKKMSTELSKDRGLINSLAQKYQTEWLTQTEINQIKRLYQQNNKFGYLKEAIDPTGVARATNVLDGIRDWQFKTASDNGFTNLWAINKNTQAYKFISRELSKKLDKASGNNAISLTDWIVATGSPYGFSGVVAKKLLSTETAKSLLLRWLTRGKKTIPSIEKASRADIIKKQVQKVYGLSDNNYSDLTFSSTLDRKGLRTLPPPSGKPTTTSGIIDVQPQVVWPRWPNPPDITSRSKIVKPWTYTENTSKLPQKAPIQKTEPKAKLRTNEDALKKPTPKVKANLPKESKLPKKQETPKTSNIDHELESLQKQYETLPWVPKVEVPADYIPKDWLPTWTEFEAPIISSISKTKWKLPSPDVKRPQIRWFDLSTRSSMLESLKEQGMFTDSFFVVKDKNVSNKLFEYAEKKAIKKWNPTSGTKVDMKALVERAENGADTLLTPKEYMKLWKENGVYLRMDIWNWNQVAVNASYADIFFKNFDDVTFKWNNELSPVVVLSKWEPVWVIMPIKDVYSLKGKLGDFSMQSKTPQVEGKTKKAQALSQKSEVKYSEAVKPELEPLKEFLTKQKNYDDKFAELSVKANEIAKEYPWVMWTISEEWRKIPANKKILEDLAYYKKLSQSFNELESSKKFIKQMWKMSIMERKALRNLIK